jgi:hypothetical protein
MDGGGDLAGAGEVTESSTIPTMILIPAPTAVASAAGGLRSIM